MTRTEFIKMCGLLGLSIPFQSVLASCETNDDTAANGNTNTNKSVLIIGAGAAGLTAAHLLKQRGITAQILEASSAYGGRMKRTTDFANFPIPLGAEWLHVNRGIFNEIVNDTNVQVNINTTPYNPAVDYGLVNGQQVSTSDIGFTIDQKFINATWFDFFEQYVVPQVQQQILYNKVVQAIDYSGAKVVVRTADAQYTADKVIVTVPVKLLQNGMINFTPSLPNEKAAAINNVTVWDGCKAFIEFSEKFYPTFVGYQITPETAGQKLYYDASYGQNTTQHILGLFAVGTGTLPYVNLSDTDMIAYMLNELDAIFDGKASATYVKHIFQNWNAEPFANGAYVYDHEDWRNVRRLGESVGNNLFFAGDAYTDGSDWGSVHAAARSAIRAVNGVIN